MQVWIRSYGSPWRFSAKNLPIGKIMVNNRQQDNTGNRYTAGKNVQPYR
jgi:hypothetical protein